MTKFTPINLNFRGERNCDKCGLCKTRQRVVTGHGNPTAKIMIISEKPGPDENISARPFTGPSGQLLRNYMRTAKLNLDYECFVTNVVKCVTPGGRKPGVKEVNSCRPWLNQEIKFVDPDIIVLMGEVAMKELLPGESTKITQVRGHVYTREIEGRERLVMPTIHPAFVARNPQALARDFMADLYKLRTIADKGYNPIRSFRTSRGTWEEVLEVINAGEETGLDFETSALIDLIDVRVIGIGVCNTPGNGVYYPFASAEEAAEKLESIRGFFESESITKVASNVKFEMIMLANYGIKLNNYKDTMLEAWLCGDFPLSLKDGFHRASDEEMIRISKFQKMGFIAYDYHQVSKSSPKGKRILDLEAAQKELPDAVAEYAAQDPDASLRLSRYLSPILASRGLQELYETIELPFVRVLADIERTGFQLDPERLAPFAAECDRGLIEVKQQIADLGFDGLNVMSTPQVIAALYHTPGPYQIPEADDLNDPTPTDKTSLAIHMDNPLVVAVLTERAIRKMQGTYIEALPRWQLPDGRIYPQFKQSAADTGRMSSVRPNITNQPSRKRDDISVELDGGLIRLAYVAQDGMAIVAADISQIEKRISAHVSEDPDMLYYLSDPSRDIHGNTTTKMYKITKDDVSERDWKNKRDTAKMIGFGIDYGLTDVGLVKRAPKAGLSVEEAAELIKAYYETYPGVREWQLRTKRETFKRGYAETIMGRRRYLPEITSKSQARQNEAARQAINLPIQGSAADFFKMAALKTWQFIQDNNLRTRIVALVHDEVVMEAPFDEIDLLYQHVPALMANAIPLRLPVFVDFEVGPSWGEVKEYSKWRKTA